jgi:hypothetical protein
MPFETPKLTKRDYAIGAAVVFAAVLVLVGLMYAVVRIVNVWFPVGCTQ